MNIDLPAGKYVVAVSGGVDSVVLLDMLASRPELDLVVAHFDHGIRSDSAEDREFVENLAGKYGLPFVYERVELGPGASEAAAREVRYAFLQKVRTEQGAEAIITAHHQDDVLETVVLNLLRGTGRRGLTSLKSTDIVKRPLLHIPKKQLLRYAKRAGLQWHEDSTNVDEKYLRNYVRKNILPRFAETDREVLLELVQNMRETNKQLDLVLGQYLRAQPAGTQLDRQAFILLSHAESREVLASWLRAAADTELSSRLLERLVVAAKTGRSGMAVDVASGYKLKLSKDLLALIGPER